MAPRLVEATRQAAPNLTLKEEGREWTLNRGGWWPALRRRGLETLPLPAYAYPLVDCVKRETQTGCPCLPAAQPREATPRQEEEGGHLKLCVVWILGKAVDGREEKGHLAEREKKLRPRNLWVG